MEIAIMNIIADKTLNSTQNVKKALLFKQEKKNFTYQLLSRDY